MDDHFNQLVEYIERLQDQEVPQDRIRQTLLQHNWHPEVVDKAFALIKSFQTPYTIPQSELDKIESAATTQQIAQPVYVAPVQPAPAAQPAVPASETDILPRPNPEPIVTAQPTVASAPVRAASAAQPVSAIQPAGPYRPVDTTPNISPIAAQKYKVFRAIGDTVQAIRSNAATFFLSVALSYAAAVAFFFLISFISGKVLQGGSGLLFASTPKMLGILFGGLVLYTAWYALAGAFTLAVTSLALYDGAENRKGLLAETMSHGFSRLRRVVLADVLFCVVAFWPLAFMIFVPIILLMSGAGGGFSLILLPILFIAALFWIYIAFLRFSLAPYIALFEPDVPITKTLGRSKHLLVKGGQWFLVKGFLIVLVVLIIVSLMAGQNLNDLMASQNIVVNIVLILVSVVVNGVLVMLYRNRSIARG